MHVHVQFVALMEFAFRALELFTSKRMGTNGYEWVRMGMNGYAWGRMGTHGYEWVRMGTGDGGR